MASKYKTITAELRRQIEAGVYPPGSMLPVELTLCDKFGVSRQTIRQALALLADEGYIQRRQGSGSRVLDRKAQLPRRTVAVITTYISNYIFPSILREIESVLCENNATPTLFSTQNQIANERKILKTLLEGTPPDGILVEGTKTVYPNPNLDLYRQLMDRGIPMVFLHGVYPELQAPVYVLDDNFGGARQLVQYLYKKGHRSIMAMFKGDDLQGLQRYSGFVHALRDLNLSLDDRQVLWYNTENRDHLLSEEIFANKLQPLWRNCSAMVCYNDEVAARVIGLLTAKGLRIPEDMAVVSFDNSIYSELSSVPITSLSHGEHNVGRMAAELLIRLFNGQPVQPQVAPWEIVQRQSG